MFMQSAIKKWSALATDLEFAAGALIDAYDLMFDKDDQTRTKEEQRGINIQSLLAAQRHLKCLREVDKVFSIQSLTGQNVQRLLTLDYSKPVEWTFSMAVKAYVETSEDIEILCEAMSHDPARPYPSWCPDWTVPRTRSQLGGYPHESGYRASGQVLARASFSKDLKTITLNGIIFVDTIKDTQMQKTAEEFKWEHCESGLKCNWNPVTTADDLAILKERLSASKLGVRSGSLETTYREELLVTMVGGLISVDGTIRRLDVEWFEKQIPKHNLLNKPPSLDLVPEIDSMWPRNRENYFRDVRDRTWGRTILRSSKGLLGLGPREIREGDCIYIIEGCSVPIILRKNQDKSYAWIGDAYIHNMMDWPNIARWGYSEHVDEIMIR